MYINIKKAKKGRICVQSSDIFALKGLLKDFPDGRHTQTFDLGKKRTLSCIDISGLGLEEEVIWAKLNGRTAVCPLIERERLPKKSETSEMTLVFSKKKGYVIVIAAYYGPKTPKFPDSLKKDDPERQKAELFWNTNVLVLGNKDRIVLAPKPEWAKWSQTTRHARCGVIPYCF